MSTTTLPTARGVETAQMAPPPKSRRPMVAVLLLAVLAGAAAGYWFFLKPVDAGVPVPGEVVALDAVQVNLADGHYLSVGIAMQLSEEAQDTDGSKALDATIDMFSGRKIEDLGNPATRRTLRATLGQQISELYEGEVLEVYFTQFVTQ